MKQRYNELTVDELNTELAMTTCINIVRFFGITEYAEDIYPYATFQEARGTDDQEASSFQTFVFRDPRVMPPHAVSASHQQEYRKV
jgi:hypothetical protein